MKQCNDESHNFENNILGKFDCICIFKKDNSTTRRKQTLFVVSHIDIDLCYWLHYFVYFRILYV